jgi:hypothetical protein
MAQAKIVKAKDTQPADARVMFNELESRFRFLEVNAYLSEIHPHDLFIARGAQELSALLLGWESKLTPWVLPRRKGPKPITLDLPKLSTKEKKCFLNMPCDFADDGQVSMGVQPLIDISSRIFYHSIHRSVAKSFHKDPTDWEAMTELSRKFVGQADTMAGELAARWVQSGTPNSAAVAPMMQSAIVHTDKLRDLFNSLAPNEESSPMPWANTAARAHYYIEVFTYLEHRFLNPLPHLPQPLFDVTWWSGLQPILEKETHNPKNQTELSCDDFEVAIELV